MKHIKKTSKKALALLISFLMVFSVCQVSIFNVFASSETTVSSNIGKTIFYNGEPSEFTFTTTATAADANKPVKASFVFSDPSIVEKLEYLNTDTYIWHEFTGEYGPDDGFALTDNSSIKLRATFKKVGNFSVVISIIDATDRTTLCQTKNTIMVQEAPTEFTTDIKGKIFEVDQVTEFTYTAQANNYADVPVYYNFKLTDTKSREIKAAIKRLQYLDEDTNTWIDVYGDFGNTDVGVPFKDSALKFRIVFNRVGVFNVRVSIMKIEDNKELYSKKNEIKVQDTVAPEIAKINGVPTYWTNQDATLSVVLKEETSNVVRYRVNEGEWQTSPEFVVGENGVYVFETTDESDNIASYTLNIKDIFDKIAPDATVSLDPNALSPDGEWTKDEITVTITVVENESGVKDYIVDGVSQKTNTFTLTDDEEHTVKVTDNAGNESALITFSAKYDITPPVIESIDGNPTEWTRFDVTLTVSATDAGCQGIQYSIDNKNWNSDGIFEITENGEYTIYVRDLLENTTSQVVKVTKIDKVPPEILDFTSTTEDWTNKDVTISGTFDDNSKDTIAAFIKIGDGEWEPYAFADNKLEYTITEECDTTYSFKCVDLAGNESEVYTKTVKIDKTAPELTVNPITEDWKNTQIDITGTVSDDASGIKTAIYTANEANDTGDLDITGKDYFFTTALTATGEYTYKVTVTDNAGNVSEATTTTFKLDLDAPTFKSVTPSIEGWTNQSVRVTVDVDDIGSGIYEVFHMKGEEKVVWTEENGKYYYDIPNNADDNSVYEINCVDVAGNSSVEDYTAMIDITSPEVPVIKYSTSAIAKFVEKITFGLYKAPETVTITSSDALSQLKEIKFFFGDEEQQTVELDGNSIKFTIPVDFKNSVSAIAYDNAGNNSAEQTIGSDPDGVEFEGVIIDDKPPVVETVEASKTDWTNESIKISGTVSDNLSMVEKVYYRISDDATEIAVIDFDAENGTYSFEIDARDFTGFIYVGCYDYVGNKADEEFVTVYMDITAPVIEPVEPPRGQVTIEGSVNDPEVNGAKSGVELIEYTFGNITETTTPNEDGTFEVTVSVNNFNGTVTFYCIDKAGNRSEPKSVEIVVDTTPPVIDTAVATPIDWTNGNVIFTCTAHDVEKNIGDFVSGVAYVAFKYEGENGLVEGTATFENDVYTFSIPAQNFNGTVEIWCVDNAGNISDVKPVEVKMDTEAPSVTKIEYKESLIKKFLNAVTFGIYNDTVNVTVTAEDNFVVDYIDCFLEDKLVKDLTTETTGTSYVAKFSISPEFVGKVSAVAYDKAKNNSEALEKGTDANGVTYDKIMIDNKNPIIEVKYSSNAAAYTVDGITYYGDTVKATITVDESNFYEGITSQGTDVISDFKMTVKKSNDENSTIYNGKDIVWTNNGSKHSFELTLQDETDYDIIIEYTDFAGNKAENYTKSITIDKTAPIVDVVFSEDEVINTIGNRDYYDVNRTATITVTEHNFRASDFIPEITALDVIGATVAGAQIGDWETNGDVHTLTINFSNDANYTFDYSFKDLAGNACANYETKEFTVDKVAPNNLTVTYIGEIKETIVDKVLNVVTFGYYNAQVTVKITADDATSGITHFVYSYIKSTGASSVNAELIDERIETQIEQDGKTFTTTFTIPKEALKDTNQFNGTVKFTAFDKVNKSTEHKETSTIIIDNIKPNATISYNAPVKVSNDTSFYNGNVEAKIVINEANFYSEDAVVTVTRNGADYPVTVKWINDSADIHTGVFTLKEDGDYYVTVDYSDRSDNVMDTYKSGMITIDTVAPTLTLSNVVNNSANKTDKYSFTITAKDININSSSFKPLLKAVIQKEDGSFAIKEIPFGSMNTITNGKEYSYSIDNLTEDAIYTLTATVKDMSNNTTSKLLLKDGKSYGDVNFSINRKGSTYAISDKTSALIEKYYVQEVTDDVVLIETNVDPLGSYKVTLNGKELTENTDFTVTKSGADGEWKKYTYSVKKSLFSSEGEYKVIVSSKDKAENDAFSDVKNAGVTFVVDRTAPIVTVTGLASDGRYQTDKQTVTLIPTDDGGALKSLVVRTVDEDGKELKELLNLSGEKLNKALEEGSGKITFEISSGLYQNIQIVCDDCAVDENGDTNTFDRTYTNVSVSSNIFMIFWANKPLRWGAIAGVLLLMAIIIVVIVMKKRKSR